MMIAKNKSRLVVLVLIASMLLQAFGSVAVYGAALSEQEYATKQNNSETENSRDAMKELMVSTAYSEYLVLYDEIPDAKESIRIEAENYVREEDAGQQSQNAASQSAYAEVRIVDGMYLDTPGSGKVSFKFTAPETAMYTIKLRYLPLTGDGGWIVSENGANSTDDDSHNSNIERILLIDDLVPFKEARTLNFSRTWVDDYANGFDKDGRYKFNRDINMNEMRPIKVEDPEWTETYLYDSETFYEDPLKFYFEKGEHTITLDAASEPLRLDWIEVGYAEPLKSYKDYLEEHKDAPTPKAQPIIVHAETPSATSEQVIYAMNDRTSGITYPQDPAQSLLNTLGGNGGDKWKNPGQWVRYEVLITESGWYDIVPRFKQTINQGLFSSRAVKIDNEYPFEEARGLQFKYADDWQVAPLNDGKTNFKFYLEASEKPHVIEFKAVLGDMADLLNEIEGIQTRLNDYYRQILMITGSEPDEFTDYEFSKLIPGVLTGMKTEKQNLQNVSLRLEKKIGTKGENTVILDRIAFLLGEMSGDETKIAANLGNFKSYIGSLGTWLLSTKAQPLQLDSIYVQPTGTKLPKANANFFQSMGHELSSFAMSFFTDYNSIGASQKIEDDDPNAVEVWITTGRDQATIMRQLVDGSFNSEDIAVNLKLIAAGTLLPATLAGVGPDVSMDADPNGYGIRNAVIPLNYFEAETVGKINDRVSIKNKQPVLSYSDVKQAYFSNEDGQVIEELFVPLTILDPDRVEYVDKDNPDKGYKVVDGVVRDGRVAYGLPYTIDFPMLFYRKDIFVELGLDVPETWDQVETTIRALSEKQMEMGFSQAMTQIYMYQSGHEWFKSARDYAQYYPNGEVSEREYLRTVGIESNLGSNGALDAFQRMTEWFTLYGEPVSYDFANRFRTGEMPIAIANYTTYNQLKVFAPEIAGLWEFVQLPGVERTVEVINEETGETETKTYIDHSTPGTPQAVMMMKDAADDIKDGQDITESKKAQNAWAFLQWWVSTDTQVKFGQEQVALMGTAAKYNTANIDALLGQSWTAQEKKNLEQQFASLKGTPMSPGNYIVARYTNFAFYNVVNDGEVAAEALRGYVDDIDHELSRKRAEYGFITKEDYFKEDRFKGANLG